MGSPRKRARILSRVVQVAYPRAMIITVQIQATPLEAAVVYGVRTLAQLAKVRALTGQTLTAREDLQLALERLAVNLPNTVLALQILQAEPITWKPETTDTLSFLMNIFERILEGLEDALSENRQAVYAKAGFWVQYQALERAIRAVTPPLEGFIERVVQSRPDYQARAKVALTEALEGRTVIVPEDVLGWLARATP